MIKDEVKKQLNLCLKKYPSNHKRSAVMDTLMIVQKENGGFLSSNLIEEVAEYLSLPKISVMEIATFYSLYNLQPVGRNQIQVCHNISCLLRDCDDILDYLTKKIGIKIGQVDKEGRFSIYKVECLGQCVDAPVMRINGKIYTNLTKEKIDNILLSHE